MECILCCWFSTPGDVFSQQFDDMFGLLQSLEARLTNLHGVLIDLFICLYLFYWHDAMQSAVMPQYVIRLSVSLSVCLWHSGMFFTQVRILQK